MPVTDQREYFGLHDADRAQVQDGSARALYVGPARSKSLHRVAARQQQQAQRAAHVIVYDVEVQAEWVGLCEGRKQGMEPVETE